MSVNQAETKHFMEPTSNMDVLEGGGGAENLCKCFLTAVFLILKNSKNIGKIQKSKTREGKFDVRLVINTHCPTQCW